MSDNQAPKGWLDRAASTTIEVLGNVQIVGAIIVIGFVIYEFLAQLN